MTVKYAVDTTATYMRVGREYQASPYKLSVSRAFLKFDLSGEGLSLGDIDYVQLRVRCSAITGTNSVELWSGGASNNWGSTLDKTEADFTSTDDNLEDTVGISGVGTDQYFDVDKNHLDLSGTTYFRFNSTDEISGSTEYVQFRTQDSPLAVRPKLLITMLSGVTIEVDALSVAGTANDCSLVPEGVASVAADCLELVSSALDLTIVPIGSATLGLSALELESSASALLVLGSGTATVDLDSVLSSASVQVVAIVPEGVAATALDVVSVAAGPGKITVTPVGEASVLLDALTALLEAEPATILLIGDDLTYPICLVATFGRIQAMAAGFGLGEEVSAGWPQPQSIQAGSSECE